MKLVNSLALVLVFLACHVACMNGLMKGVVKSSLRKAVKNNRAIFKATSMNKKEYKRYEKCEGTKCTDILDEQGRVGWIIGNLQLSTCKNPTFQLEAEAIQFDALRYKPNFDSLLDNLQIFSVATFGSDDVHAHPAPVKGVPRMLEKLKGKYNDAGKNGCTEVTDACRGSLYFRKAGGVCGLLKKLGEKEILFKDDCDPKIEICLPIGMEKLEVANVKNRMSEAARGSEVDVAYRDTLVNIKMYKEKDGGDFHIAVKEMFSRLFPRCYTLAI